MGSVMLLVHMYLTVSRVYMESIQCEAGGYIEKRARSWCWELKTVKNNRGNAIITLLGLLNKARVKKIS